MAEMTANERQMLQPAFGLWKQFDPSAATFAFRATARRSAELWQKRTRKALGEILGFQDLPAVAPRPKLLERIDRGDYIREKVLIRTTPHSAMPVYVLVPKGASKPLPVVLAFHGHGYGVKDIVGLWEDGGERYAADGYHKDFAVALCRRGFLVAAPEISCFGERQTDFSYLKEALSPEPTTCAHTTMLAFYLGGTAIGLRVLDAGRLVDYLETRADADVSRLGAMGISGGGAHTFYSTCMDTRIRACVVSGYYCAWRRSILAMNHCSCNFVPGLHEFGEIHDLVGLIAPRPMLVEAGTRDNIFPISGVRHAVARGRKVYDIWDAPQEMETDYFEGRHRISGARAYDFLTEKLS